MIRLRWITPQHLGTLVNGQISDISVLATASDNSTVSYSIVGTATFPRCLYFNATTGELVGRVAFQSSNVNQTQNETRTYTFTVRARLNSNPSITLDRTFTFQTVQKFITPYDNLYIKALLTPQQRVQIQSLLSNVNLIPTQYLYRNSDPYYGVARDVIYQHAFGVPSSLSCQYANAVVENHYNRDITLGSLQLAQARDRNNNILYEVVYSLVQDNLVNNAGISISKTVNWPREANGRTQFYPASLPNMRIQIDETLGFIDDPIILPRWMTSQQSNGNIIGFSPAFVVCYAKPGFGQYIINNINQLWTYKLNQFQFTIDRIIVDRSLSYQYYGGATVTPPSNIAGFNGTQYVLNDMNTYDESIYVPQNIMSVGTTVPNCGT